MYIHRHFFFTFARASILYKGINCVQGVPVIRKKNTNKWHPQWSLLLKQLH